MAKQVSSNADTTWVGKSVDTPYGQNYSPIIFMDFENPAGQSTPLGIENDTGAVDSKPARPGKTGRSGTTLRQTKDDGK